MTIRPDDMIQKVADNAYAETIRQLKDQFNSYLILRIFFNLLNGLTLEEKNQIIDEVISTWSSTLLTLAKSVSSPYLVACSCINLPSSRPLIPAGKPG